MCSSEMKNKVAFYNHAAALPKRGRRGRVRMVVGFTTTYAINVVVIVW